MQSRNVLLRPLASAPQLLHLIFFLSFPPPFLLSSFAGKREGNKGKELAMNNGGSELMKRARERETLMLRQ